MILATVGTQLPFDRFIRIVDEAAPGLAMPVFAQTGQGSYVPHNMEWKALIEPIEFDALEGRPGMYVARTAEQLVALMGQELAPPEPLVANASRDRLLGAVADFIRRG